MKKLLCVLFASAMLMTGCGKGDVYMKVGTVEIPNEVAEYLTQAFISQGADEKTAKEQVDVQLEAMGKCVAVGKEMNLEIIEDYSDYLKQIVSTGGDIEQFKKNAGISDEAFDFICYADVYQMNIIEKCREEKGITDEAVDEYFKTNFWRAKHLLLQTEGKTDEEKAEIKAKIDDLYNQVKAGADFDALIAEHNEDPGVQSNPDGYVFTAGEMVSEFEEGVKNINVGEYNLVETSYGYHIVKRLALDETPEKYEQFKNANSIKIDNALVGADINQYIDDKAAQFGIEVEK